MTLAIALGASWLVVVAGVVAMFRVAARADEVRPPAGWQASGPLRDAAPAPPGGPGAEAPPPPALPRAQILTGEPDARRSGAAHGSWTVTLGQRVGQGASLRHFS
jgi:hypothetical protein